MKRKIHIDSFTHTQTMQDTFLFKINFTSTYKTVIYLMGSGCVTPLSTTFKFGGRNQDCVAQTSIKFKSQLNLKTFQVTLIVN